MGEREDMLSHALLWDETGHLSDPALHALADGELELLPSQVVQHVETCASCSERVGEIALFALEVDSAIVGAIHAPQLTAAHPPLRAIAASLLIALIAGWPALRASLPQLLSLWSPRLWLGAARGLAQVLVQAAHSGVLNMLVWTSAAGLLAVSAALVHISSAPHGARGQE